MRFSNSWYRLRPSIVQDSETKEAAVQFKHPVAPGNDDSGWMKPNPADADDDGGSGSGDDRVLSLEEIAKHDKRIPPPSLLLKYCGLNKHRKTRGLSSITRFTT